MAILFLYSHLIEKMTIYRAYLFDLGDKIIDQGLICDVIYETVELGKHLAEFGWWWLVCRLNKDNMLILDGQMLFLSKNLPILRKILPVTQRWNIHVCV